MFSTLLNLIVLIMGELFETNIKQDFLNILKQYVSILENTVEDQENLKIFLRQAELQHYYEKFR